MSVLIVEVLPDGSARSIRDDGDSLEHVLSVLDASYKSEMQMRRLMWLGNIRHLGMFVEPFEGVNNFVDPLPDVTLSYERDGGDQRWPVHNYRCLDEALFFAWSDYGTKFAVIYENGCFRAVKLEENDVNIIPAD